MCEEKCTTDQRISYYPCKLADMVTFPIKASSKVKKLQICISFVNNLRKQCLCYLMFYKWWKPHKFPSGFFETLIFIRSLSKILIFSFCGIQACLWNPDLFSVKKNVGKSGSALFRNLTKF